MKEIMHEQSGVLYHVTIAQNVQSIYQDGVDPQYSTGKLQASWYVNKQNIPWAIMHVALKYDLTLKDVFVCAVVVDWKSMRRTSRPGRYYTHAKYVIEHASPAAWHVLDENYG